MSTITVYRVPPQQEFKAARELRQAGFRAYLPVETVKRRRQPVARGYIAADGKPNEAKHVRKRVGEVERVELIKLYQRRDRGHEKPQVAFEAGNTVKLSQRYTVDKGKTVDVVGILVKTERHRSGKGDRYGHQYFARRNRVGYETGSAHGEVHRHPTVRRQGLPRRSYVKPQDWEPRVPDQQWRVRVFRHQGRS